MSERIVGLDPSLTSTGFAVITRTEEVRTPHTVVLRRISLATVVVKGDHSPELTGALADAHRVQDIVEQVCTSAHDAIAVGIEELPPMRGAKSGKYAERAHLYFSLLAALHARGHDVVTFKPSSLKKRFTGDGRADKQKVLDAVRHRWSQSGWVDTPATGRFDRADAAALATVVASDHGWYVGDLPISDTQQDHPVAA